MEQKRSTWIFGLLGVFFLIAAPIAYFWPADRETPASPWETVPVRLTETDHSPLLTGPYETPQEVTAACLECHPDAASQVMATSHWTWTSEPAAVEWTVLMRGAPALS